jgi:GNAT superfamily N-acetyltransferase
MQFTENTLPPSLTTAQLAEAWVQGWVLSRQTPAAIDHGTHLTIPVGVPGHMVRHVFPALNTDALQALARGECVAGTWLKVVASREAVRPLLPPNWEIHEREYLMLAPLGNTSPASRGNVALPLSLIPTGDGRLRPALGRSDAPMVNFERNGNVVAARLLGPNGDSAAHAKAALLGSTAVFDQVVTELHQRRKGYGSMLMSFLATECWFKGATVGVLVATEEGRLLYSALGWQVASEVTAVSCTAQ